MMYLTSDTYTDEFGVVHPKGEKKVVEIITNPLAIINRTIPMAMLETSITFILDRVRQHMKTLSVEEAKDFLFDVLSILNPKFGKEIVALYKSLTDREKKEFMRDAIDDAITIRWEAFDPKLVWRDNIIKCYEKYPNILKGYHIFKPKPNWGRDVYVGKDNIGFQYMYVLKQSAARGYSVRSAGAVGDESLPERSNENKIGRSPVSDTPMNYTCRMKIS